MSTNNDTKTNDTEYVEIPNPFEEQEKEFIGLEPYKKIKECRIESLSFQDWNRKQDISNRIGYVRKFSTESIKIKVLQGVPGTAPSKDKQGNPITISYTSYPIKEDRGDGREMSVTTESPTFISKRGYRISETTAGEIKSIAHMIDFSNPHHRQWWEVSVMSVVKGFIEHIMTIPADFGIEEAPITNFSDRTTEEYKDLYKEIFKKLPKLARVPKNGKELDLASNVRMVYCNPIDYVDKDDQTKSNKMKVYYGGSEMSPENLLKICEGWQSSPDGPIKGKPQGFEFSYTLLIHKGTKTNGISISFKTTAVYIHRFFNAPDRSSKTDENANEISKDIVDASVDYSKYFLAEDEKIPEVIPNNKDFNPIVQNSAEEPVAVAVAVPESNLPSIHQVQAPPVPSPPTFVPPVLKTVEPVTTQLPSDLPNIPNLAVNPTLPTFVPAGFTESSY